MVEPCDLKYPHSIVWASLPGLTTITRVLGHIGITDSKGVIYDAAGARQVGEHKLFCGPVRKVLTLRVDDVEKWDHCVRETNEYYRQNTYSFFTQNCHHHVAMAMNKYGYEGRSDWGPMSLAWLMCREAINV